MLVFRLWSPRAVFEYHRNLNFHCLLCVAQQTRIIRSPILKPAATDRCSMKVQEKKVKEMKDNSSAASLRDIQAGLERLERREWWRWGTALTITLLLTLGVLALSQGLGKEIIASNEFDLHLALPGLLALVLIFDFFVLYQQLRISRLRRQLAGQIGMLAALEVLKPADCDEQAGQRERRRANRLPLDQRLTVKALIQGEPAILYGRVIDISELGLGAVISGSLDRGDQVALEINLGADSISLNAVIRYARGFRHGFEFLGLTAEERKRLERLCGAAAASGASQWQGGSVSECKRTAVAVL
jgi:PilZ domain-containing protein